MSDWQEVVDALRGQGIELRAPAAPRRSANAAWRAETTGGPVFLKTCAAADRERLAAEAEGLEALERAGAIRVPRVLARVSAGKLACLALEWLAFETPDRAVEECLGAGLAALHRHTGSRFGWHRDNTIGLTPQLNTPDEDWLRFFRDRRLGYQLQLAERNGYGGELQAAGARLLRNLVHLLEGHDPVPSLLHGDLWGGNWAAVAGRPVIFDPAVYYGDRETDLAMTRLFGGFGTSFYRAYQEAWPLAAGHQARMPLYQLYHVLNHLNLFGSGYLGQALALMRRLDSAA